jgi:hypothetical protein
MAVEGPESHYLDRPHFGFMLNMASGTSHSPPANKENKLMLILITIKKK